MFLSSAFTDLYVPKRLRSARPSTLRRWRVTLRTFDKFLERRAVLDDLCDDTLEQFTIWRLSTVSAATANTDVKTLLALSRFLARRQLLDRWPDVPLTPEPVRTPRAWSRDEFSRLVAAAGRTPGTVGQCPAGLWWQALCLVIYDTGERIGAVMRLRWTDVDLDARWIVFPAEARKGGRADSACQIHQQTAALLARLPKTRNFVFAWPRSYVSLWGDFARILRSAGLPSDRRDKFHRIRRTTASHAAASGADPTALLRHASRTTTARYLDPTILTPSQAVDYLWRPTLETDT